MKEMNNQVRLIGNLGDDPQVFTFDSGRKLAKFSIATNDYYRAADGEKVKKTTWHNIVAWGKTAELMGERLHKGAQVIIDGKLANSTYTNKEGVTIYRTEILAGQFHTIDRKEALPF